MTRRVLLAIAFALGACATTQSPTRRTTARTQMPGRFDVARSPTTAPTPPAVQELPPQESPTDINEGPSAPQSIPDQNFAR